MRPYRWDYDIKMSLEVYGLKYYMLEEWIQWLIPVSKVMNLWGI
jgi:hypothetical protein